MNACLNNITPEQLSAYRSHALDQTEMTRFTAHIVDCAACQDILRHYERFAQGLHAQASPLDGGRLWRIIHQHITNERGTHMPQSRRLWLSAALITSALIVVTVASFLVLNYQPGKTTLVATATTAPTSTIMPTPVPLLSSDKVTKGWIAGPAWGLSVAVVQGDPNTIYVCGIDTDKQSILLGESQDGGKTWRAHHTMMRGTGCVISVNPQQANDVIIGATTDSHDPTSMVHPATLWRSFDSGIDFTKISLDGATTDSPFAPTVAWVGTTLFVVGNESGVGVLLQSEHGNPLVSNSTSVSSPYELISSLGSTIIYQDHCPVGNTCTGDFAWMLPLGQLPTSNINVPCQNGHTEIAANSFDGHSSVGLCNENQPMNPQHSQYYLSRDSFKTWIKLPTGTIACPALSPNVFASCNITPDGTLYGFNNLSSAPMLVKVTPESDSVVSAMSDAMEPFPQTWLGWNAAGHATVIWAVLNGGGVEYHSLT